MDTQTRENERTASMEATPETVLSVDSLWKVYGDGAEQALSDEYQDLSKSEIQDQLGWVIALKDVSLEVKRGETFVVMGLSGSGKSTLVRCLNGLIEPTSGDVNVLGTSLTGITRDELTQLRRNSLAMVFQHYALFPHRSVIENAAWGLEIQGVGRRRRNTKARDMLGLVGLQGWEDSYPAELSGGMMQRVGLARALTLEPEILLMDEPFSGLDPLIRREMQSELLRLKASLHAELGTIVFITHDLDEAVTVGDRIAIMNDGEVVQIGSPEDVVLRPADDYVEDFTSDVRYESVATAAHSMSAPETVIAADESLEAALAKIEEGDSPVGFVVDGSGKYLGVLSERRARRAVRRGEEDLESVMRTDEPSVTPETGFDELVHIGMASEHAVPVVDESGGLVGEIQRVTLAAEMAERWTDTENGKQDSGGSAAGPPETPSVPKQPE